MKMRVLSCYLLLPRAGKSFWGAAGAWSTSVEWMRGSFGCWVDHGSEAMQGWRRFAEKARVDLKDKFNDESPHITDTVVQSARNTNRFKVPLTTELRQPVSATQLNHASVSSPRRG